MDYPYNLHVQLKQQQLLQGLNELTLHHIDNNAAYRAMLEKSGSLQQSTRLQALPYLPVQLFKLMDLISVPQERIVKVLTSSGTTGQQVSKIYLDKETALQQSKALVEVMKPILGTQRIPMIILDTKSVLKDRRSFSARGAGILGFANFGRQHFYALNDDMSVDWEGLAQFISQHEGTQILLFGFTYMIWKHVYLEAKQKEISINFGDSLLIHGGGWKKLQDEAVDAATFKSELQRVLGIRQIHNYYGMVEQVGSIFVECKHGHLHTPNFADVIIRDPITFEVLPNGQQGLIQVLSLLPKSYPGHSLLTEDLGVIHGEDDCPCGWKGKYFSVEGRIPKAELRGCSDTYAFGQGGGKHE
ncbi:acyl-protein synthetase [Paenibacillus sp. DXFW5]|uniref:Acyl-protein synthetase n=1 Tax=Paenibacillus rhizolycopersici TaxID=2780073 RepID=A0ABS2H751_9BACL|nr:acyl-protein synthetase [Paenibacillus rhizolycopersici]MBM6997250.1 acyl-protein synthetase [Paenibacillus rhizolycopersici]